MSQSSTVVRAATWAPIERSDTTVRIAVIICEVVLRRVVRVVIRSTEHKWDVAERRIALELLRQVTLLRTLDRRQAVAPRYCKAQNHSHAQHLTTNGGGEEKRMVSARWGVFQSSGLSFT